MVKIWLKYGQLILCLLPKYVLAQYTGQRTIFCGFKFHDLHFTHKLHDT